MLGFGRCGLKASITEVFINNASNSTNNVVQVVTLATLPSSPTLYQAVIVSDTGKLAVWNGSIWVYPAGN